MTPPLPPILLDILVQTPELRSAYLVGGFVRDWLLKIPHHDFDIEVFDCTYEQLSKALARWGRVDLVGRSFGVIKLSLPDHVFDFSLPRRDSKIGIGHKGFQIHLDESITPIEAAARRDYTINSLMYNPRENRILDFFHGENDLRNRVLRHTSPAFPEDPLRVLRGMQFASRFNLIAAPETVTLAREIKASHQELPRERIREEWFKWAAKSETPSLGLRFLNETEWIEFYPELAAIRGVPQDTQWHPEGDVFTHTLHVCDAMATLPQWRALQENQRTVLMLAVLTHDFGKAISTFEKISNGQNRIVSPGHEHAGVSLGEDFLGRIDAPLAIKERVLPLIANHMAHFDSITDRAIRRLARKVAPESIESLVLVMMADAFGRPPRPAVIPQGVLAIAAKARELAVHEKPPEQILKGRHLIEQGCMPGPAMGDLLKEAYEAQLAGDFNDLKGALKWWREHSSDSQKSDNDQS
ncbi:MAG: CCA tRNA nucleotidyltransferase [Verrucomicrobiota bacterium]